MNVGGPARHVIRIHAPLLARGWRSVLVTGRAGPHEGDLLNEARDAGLDVRVLEPLGRAIHPARDLRALAALRRLIHELRPDVVHTHTAKAGLLGRTAALGARPRPALVHTYHGHVLSGYFGPAASALFRRAEAGLARRTDRLVAVAGAVRDELVSAHGVGRREQYVVIPPGIDAARTAPDRAAGAALRARLGLRPGDVLVGCVGRLEPVKRVDRLLDAWERVAAAAPRAQLLVVGEGEHGEAVRARLQSLPRARWLAPRRELGVIYGALDVLALPSAREGLPQVVVEALAAGVPVVASAVGGVPALIEHGRTGLLVPEGDGAALAEALIALATQDGRRAELAAGARSLDLSAHGAEAVAARLADLYAELAGAPAARAAELGVEKAGVGADTALPCTSSS